MSKIVLDAVSPPQAAWLRYFSAFLSYLVAAAVITVMRSRAARFGPAFTLPKSGRDALLIAGLGFSAFCFAPFLGMTGLNASRAVDNALIIAIEPLVTALLAWIFLREKLSAVLWFSFGLALLGFSFLTGLTPALFWTGMDSHILGNLIILISLVGEAGYSIFARAVMPRYRMLGVFGTALLFGTAVLTLIVSLRTGLPALEVIQGKTALALFWLGPLGSTATYLFWLLALAEAPVASLAITLFVQPVLGGVWGIIFLGDRLGAVQWLGAFLILIAVAAQGLPMFGSRTERDIGN